MNALFNAIKDRSNIALANDGRLLKKSFFLFMFPKAIFFIKIKWFVYLLILAAMLSIRFISIGLDSLTKFDIASFLIKTKKIHVPIAALLGALPGCGGAIIVVTQYIQGRIGFGSLVAVLTATMGDAAFLILAIEPSTGLLIFVIGAIVGIISGYIIDIIHGSNYLSNPTSKIKISEKLDNTFVSNFNFIWLAIFLPGFLVGILVAFQINISEYSLS